MNKKILLVAMIVSLPGCLGQKQKKESTQNKVIAENDYERADKKSLFDEDVEGFVLEEGYDPFAAPQHENTQLTLVEASQEMDLPDKRSSQAAYGFKTIYFEFDKYDIRNDQQEALAHNVRAVKNAVGQGKKVVLEGHADNAAGSAPYNMHLSHKRAENVAHYFEGIPATQLKVVGRGVEMPIVPTGTKEQQAPNRRVELYVDETDFSA
jgi:peptidoglycan-associated lipoprotein